MAEVPRLCGDGTRDDRDVLNALFSGKYRKFASDPEMLGWNRFKFWLPPGYYTISGTVLIDVDYLLRDADPVEVEIDFQGVTIEYTGYGTPAILIRNRTNAVIYFNNLTLHGNNASVGILVEGTK